MQRRRLSVVLSLAALAGSMVASRAPAAEGVDAQGMTLVGGVSIARGTHLEFMTRLVDGVPHVFALEGSRDASAAGGWDAPGGGLNIIDISDPAHPAFVTNVPCKTDNLDIATVKFPDPSSRPVVNGITYDTIFVLASNHQGLSCSVVPRGGGPAIKGTSVSFAGIRAGARLVPGTTDLDFLGGYRSASPVIPVNPDGSRFTVWDTKFAHTVVANPARPVVYASNQNLPDRNPTVEIIDMVGTTIAGEWRPIVRSVPVQPTSAGPHDITFSPDGNRAYVSSITTSAVWDTSGDNIFAPKMVSTVLAPGLKIHHEGTLHPDGRHLLVVDEFVATSSNGNVTATPVCPGGGVHVMDLGPRGLTGPGNALEAAPVQVGHFLANDTSIPTAHLLDQSDLVGSAPHLASVGCTAHEFTIAPDGSWTPMAWMGAGVRLFDLSDLNAAAALPAPRPVVVREIGHYKTLNSNVWAAKVRPEFPGYVFVSDEAAGFQVFRVDPDILPAS